MTALYDHEDLFEAVISGTGYVIIILRYRGRFVFNELYHQRNTEWWLHSHAMTRFLKPTITNQTVTLMQLTKKIYPVYQQDVTHDIVLSKLRY